MTLPRIDDEGFLAVENDEQVPLKKSVDGLENSVHVFAEAEVRAINAALATGRALLVRGEPGTGKSQLARAAAIALGRSFVHQTVDSRTETRDLMWTLDAVARLGQAQLLAAVHTLEHPSGSTAAPEGRSVSKEDVAEHLAVERFIRPEALWWALDPKSAADQAREKGAGTCALITLPAENESVPDTVVLVDEIDKAEPSVPNGLLDALGQGGFNVPGIGRVGRTADRPLVIITTNEERALPDAFVRRCLVLHLTLPPDDDALIAWLCERGDAHFKNRNGRKGLYEAAAKLLVEDRKAAKKLRLAPPGLAEYIDLLEAIVTRKSLLKEQLALLEQVAEYVLCKHPELHKRKFPERYPEP